MNKFIIQEALGGAAQLRVYGESEYAEAIESLASEVEHYERRRTALSTLKMGDKVVMHTCMEATNPKYLGKIWTCKTDAFRPKGHNYCSIFLEGFSGSFSAEFLQLVKLPEEEAR